MRHLWLNLAIVSLILTLAFMARAEDIVLVVVPSGESVDYSPFENRLRSELSAAGHSTITTTVPTPIGPTDLPAQARRFSTNICVSVSVSDGMVVGFVSVIEPSSDRSIIRSVPGYPMGDQAASVFAVRATDVLHGVLLELNYTPNTPQKPSTAQQNSAQSSAARAPVDERKTQLPASSTEHESEPDRHVEMPPRAPLPLVKASNPPGHWGVSVGVAFDAAGSKLPVTPGGEISIFRQESSFYLSVEGSAYLPVVVTSNDAEITVNQWLAGASFSLHQPIGPAFRVFESFGSGLYGFSMSGETMKPGTKHNVSYAVGYSSLGGGLISEFNERTALALRFRVLAPWRIGDVIVRDLAGDHTVAQLKFPVILGDLGLRVSF